MNIAIKTFLELLVCIAIIFMTINEDKLINFERQILEIFRACKKKKIGAIKFLKICKCAVKIEILERKKMKEFLKGVIINVKR